MKAVVYNGPRDVRVKDVPDPKIERPTDVLVRITSTNICGSDLYMYEGRTDGDMVCLPFNIGCGFCRNCEAGLTAFCLTTNPDPNMAGAAYGFADMGPYNGGQAEYLRVPYGDFNCLRLPEDAREKQDDYVMVADIFPTAWHATELAGVKPGDSVVIYGAGPVGLMAAYSATLKQASKVMIIDLHPDRLRLGARFLHPSTDRCYEPASQAASISQCILVLLRWFLSGRKGLI